MHGASVVFHERTATDIRRMSSVSKLSDGRSIRLDLIGKEAMLNIVGDWLRARRAEADRRDLIQCELNSPPKASLLSLTPNSDLRRWADQLSAASARASRRHSG